MTPEDFASMTLGEFEAFASRVEVAARTLREAMSFLGASQVGLTQAAPPAQQPASLLTAPYAQQPASPYAAYSNAQLIAMAREQRPIWTHPSSHPFTPPPPGVLPSFEPEEHLPHLEAKKAERAAFLAQKREEPERAEMLKQFAHDANEVGEEG